MLDETIITETPPLYCCYGRRGQQVRIFITGGRAKRILHGAINIHSGEVVLLSTDVWTEQTHQYFLEMIRSHWRGWQIVLFEDRGSPHTSDDTVDVAAALRLEIRLLPTATPKLNAMDQLWRHVKERALGDRPTVSIEKSVDLACQYILQMSRQQRLRQAGILSGHFWLTS